MKKLIVNEKGQFVYEGSLIFTAKNGSIFYVSIENLIVKAYKAKAKKPFINYRYTTLENLKKSVTEKINACNELYEFKIKTKNDKKNKLIEFRQNLQVGDIFNTCWGYEQTNVEFYQVTAIKGAFCELRQIAYHSVDIGYLQSEVTPKPNLFIGEVIKRKILDRHVKINSHIVASLLEYEVIESTGTKVYKRCYTSSYA